MKIFLILKRIAKVRYFQNKIILRIAKIKYSIRKLNLRSGMLVNLFRVSNFVILFNEMLRFRKCLIFSYKNKK